MKCFISWTFDSRLKLIEHPEKYERKIVRLIVTTKPLILIDCSIVLYCYYKGSGSGVAAHGHTRRAFSIVRMPHASPA